jgi:hypothetical protein
MLTNKQGKYIERSNAEIGSPLFKRCIKVNGHTGPCYVECTHTRGKHMLETVISTLGVLNDLCLDSSRLCCSNDTARQERILLDEGHILDAPCKPLQLTPIMYKTIPARYLFAQSQYLCCMCPMKYNFEHILQVTSFGEKSKPCIAFTCAEGCVMECLNCYHLNTVEYSPISSRAYYVECYGCGSVHKKMPFKAAELFNLQGDLNSNINMYIWGEIIKGLQYVR